MISIQLIGAGCFGLIIGWYVYYINRYRKGDVQFSDLTTVIGIVGGGAVTQLFGDGEVELFGAYGVGLGIGFFGYFIVLLILVNRSKNFDFDWFLDGRRKDPMAPYAIPGDSRPPMNMPMDLPMGQPVPSTPPTIIVNAAPVSEATIEADVEPSNDANEIIAQCEAAWDAQKSDCSGFAKAVATHFSVTLNGQADDIVGQIQTEAGWAKLADGLAAKAAADAGKLVIGGLKGDDMATPQQHGHVVVVVSGPAAHGKYPSAYWGTLNGVGRKNTTINYAWRAADRDKVVYSARAV